MSHWEYIIVLAAILAFPLWLSTDPKLALFKNWRALLISILGMSLAFSIWDIVAASRGHWSFNGQYVLGVHLFGLPLEEWLFFPVVGFVSVFTWESVKYFVSRWKKQ